MTPYQFSIKVALTLGVKKNYDIVKNTNTNLYAFKKFE